MGFDDKIKNAAQEGAGKAQEGFGKAAGDENLEAKGDANQTEAQAKKVGEHLKDAGKDAFGK